MSEIMLNRADMEEINKVLQEYPDVQVFKLIRHGESGIGYCIDLEFENLTGPKMRSTTTRVEVCGVENW
jgi:hypothetical protein